MQTKDVVAGEQVKQTVLYHNASAIQKFFRGLKNKVQRAVKIAGACQVLRCIQERCGVAVMTAAVEFTLNGTAPRLAVVFLHWQRIHIGAQAQAFMPVTHLQCADHTGFRQAAMNLISPFLKQRCNAIARVVLLKTNFRMLMKIVT